MQGLMRRLRQDDAGITAFEYALIAMVIVLGIVSAVTSMGTNITQPFQTLATTISNVVNR
jgi:pilus assembly protein Flp/PilA